MTNATREILAAVDSEGIPFIPREARTNVLALLALLPESEHGRVMFCIAIGRQDLAAHYIANARP